MRRQCLAVILFAVVSIASARDTIVLSGGKLYWLRKSTTTGEPVHVLILPDVNLDEVGPPVPPPDPPQPPDPPKPPVVVSGARRVLIVRESQDATPATSRLIVGLRSGPAADYLKSKQHALLIYDDDTVDSLGKPVKIIADNAEAIAAAGLPCALVFDLNSGKLLATKKLQPTATANDVIELVKANGG